MEQQIFPNGIADMLGELAKNPAVISTLLSVLPNMLSSVGGAADSEKKEEARDMNTAPPDPIYISPDSAKEREEEGGAVPSAAHETKPTGSGRALLIALRPYLSEERQNKLDRIASLSDVLEAMGNFSSKGGGK